MTARSESNDPKPTEDKTAPGISLEQAAEGEAKIAEQVESGKDAIKVTMVSHENYQDPESGDVKALIPGESYEVDAQTANTFVSARRATLA